MPDVLIGLGAAVVKAACKLWMRDSAFAADVSAGVADLLRDKVVGSRERRRIHTLFDDFEDMIAKRLLVVLKSEFRAVPDHECEAALLAVSDLFDTVKLADELFASDLDPLWLERAVRAANPRSAADLSLDATQLHDRVLAECCAYVIQVADVLPQFQIGVFSEILHRQSRILDVLKVVLDRLPVAGSGHAFETAYRRQVATRFDRLELFGVRVGTRKYPLSVAYLSLEATLHGHDLTSARVHEISERRLFLRGPAGAGKTTVLHWMAIQPGEDIAFFIPLRYYVDRPMPSEPEFVRHAGRHIADEMPSDWVQQRLASGKAMVLVDGVDEVPDQQRRAVRVWLRELIERYPRARFVVTSRPGAVDGIWLWREDFTVAQLQRMSPRDITVFVRQWHRAVRADLVDTEELALLDDYENSLVEAVGKQRHLRDLATNPLLCALLCAVNRDRRTHLPKDRIAVYDAALEMLLERRDAERDVENLLPVKEKRALLQEIAFWMICNGLSTVDSERLLTRVSRKLPSLHRVEADAETVLNQLLARSGVLQEPAPGQIGFVHKTFQEYFAAREVVDADQFGLLVAHAHDDQWQEVAVMAAGFANQVQRDTLLSQLLAGTENRDRLALVALSCLEVCSQVRADIRAEVYRRVGELIPPKSMEIAELLPAGGEPVLGLLAASSPSSDAEIAGTIRAASLIGGDAALALIAKYCDEPGVRQELATAWKQFDRVHYARTVLAGSAGCTHIVLDDLAMIPALSEIPALRSLFVNLPDGHGDLGFIRDLPLLQSLHVDDDPALNSLAPLAGHPSLTRFDLGFVGAPVSLAPLVSVPCLATLSVDIDSVADPIEISRCEQVATLMLRGWSAYRDLRTILPGSALTRLNLHRPLQLRDLQPLTRAEQLAELTELVLSDCKELATLDGIECWASTLKTLRLYGKGQALDLAPLAALHKLRSLTLEGFAPLDLGPVEGVSDLRVDSVR